MATAEELIKKYKGVALRATEYKQHPLIKVGPIGLMRAIGNPEGVPLGRFMQIVGNEGSGKTTLCYDIMRQFIRDYNEPVVYLNLERTLSPKYFGAALGDAAAQVVLMHPDDAETGLQIAEDVVREHGIRLVVIDSIAVMVSKKEYDKDYDESAKVAAAAGLLTRFVNRMTPVMDNKGASVIFVNQWRANFGMSREERVAFGGYSIRFANSISIELSRMGKEKGRINVRATVKKSKEGESFQTADFDIIAGKGVDHDGNTIALAKELGIIRPSGAWFYYGDLKAQGAENAAANFPMKEIRALVLEKLLTTSESSAIMGEQ